jgi:ABC-type transport system involved in multi-copper enzyme maturation permease subunit
MTVLTMARLTFKEASRRKVMLAAILLGVAFLLIFWIGFEFIASEIRNTPRGMNALAISEGSNMILMAGLYAVNFLTVMMTVLVSVDTLSGEIASGTIHTLVSKPVRRWEIVVGKWLGFAALLTCYEVMMVGGVMLAVYVVTGYTPPNPFSGIVMLWLVALLLLSVTFLGGASLSTLANGVMVFGLYGIGFVGGWIEQIGSFLNNQAAIQVGIITSLIMPTEALWKRAAYEMQSALSGMVGGMTPFSSSSVPSPAMLVYAVLYLVVVFALAIRKFQTRDL